MQILGAIASPLLSLAGGLFGKKSAGTVTPLPQATRDDAAAQQQANDDLLRRKGGAADVLTGVRGAEAPSGLKTVLG